MQQIDYICCMGFFLTACFERFGNNSGNYAEKERGNFW